MYGMLYNENEKGLGGANLLENHPTIMRYTTPSKKFDRTL
jgi:hypothetical protein